MTILTVGYVYSKNSLYRIKVGNVQSLSSIWKKLSLASIMLDNYNSPRRKFTDKERFILLYLIPIKRMFIVCYIIKDFYSVVYFDRSWIA